MLKRGVKMNCKKCGEQVNESNKFCVSCGEPVNAVLMAQTLKPQEAAQTQQIIQKKKGRGCLVAILTVFIIIGLLAGAAAIFLPGFFGPKNLNAKTSQKAYESALVKLGYVKDEAPSTGKSEDYVYKYGEIKKVNTTLTSEELSSFFNLNRPDYYAIKNVQIRVNTDNTVEISASINTKYFLDKVLGSKYNQEDIKKAVPILGILPGTINIYTKAAGAISNNKASNLNINDVEIMGINIPKSMYDTSKVQTDISNMINNFITKSNEKTGSSYDLIQPQNGGFAFNVSIPSSLTREAVK